MANWFALNQWAPNVKKTKHLLIATRVDSTEIACNSLKILLNICILMMRRKKRTKKKLAFRSCN